MRLFIAALIFSSATAMSACPDLSSVTTTCKSTTGQVPGNENQVITQQTVNGITIYTFTSNNQYGEEITKTYIADGKSRREMEIDEDTGITLLSATTVTCADNALLAHTTSFIDGQFLGVMDVMTKRSGNTVSSVYEGLRWGRDVDDIIICE